MIYTGESIINKKTKDMKEYFSELWFSRRAGILLIMFGFFFGMMSKHWWVILTFPLGGLVAYFFDSKKKINI